MILQYMLYTIYYTLYIIWYCYLFTLYLNIIYLFSIVFNTIEESSHILTVSKVPAEIFFICLFCFVSVKNDWLINLIPLPEREVMTLLSFILGHSLYLRGRHLTVLGVHNMKIASSAFSGCLPVGPCKAAHPLFSYNQGYLMGWPSAGEVYPFITYFLKCKPLDALQLAIQNVSRLSY